MKKLMTLVLGMAFVFGTVGVVFGQEAPKEPQKTEKKKSSKKKSEKKKQEEEKK